MNIQLFVAGATLALLGTAAHAAVIASDDFTYADGALASQNGGTGFDGAWTGAFGTGNSVSGGVVQSGGSGGDIRTLDFTFGSTGEYWFTIDMSSPSDQNTFAGLSFFSTTNGLSGRTEKVLIGDRSGSDVWGVAIPAGSSSVTTIDYTTMKTAVGRITLGVGQTSTIDLWVGANDSDPVDVSVAADTTLGGIEMDGVSRIRIADGSSGFSYDNFILGDTYTDVGAIPEPSSYGLLGGLLALGIVMIRRR